MAYFDINAVVQSLQEARLAWRQAQRRAVEPGGTEFPSRAALGEIVNSLKGVLFPMRLGPPDLRQESENFHVAHALDAALHALLKQIRIELKYSAGLSGATDSDVSGDALNATRAFAAALPGIRVLLDSDVLAAYQGDPAARSVDEVLLCYPGVLAMIHHRLAHRLYELELPLLARIVAELAHGETGIDIHPGATIGGNVWITDDVPPGASVTQASLQNRPCP